MVRSPFFYVGDKYKLVPQLLKYFPKKISSYIEPFYGGGSSQLQVNAEKYFLNDIDENVIRLHSFLLREMVHEKEFFNRLFKIIDQYGLSCSYKINPVPEELRKAYPKTYYSHYNKDAYNALKADFIEEGQFDDYKLYLLLIYGFNHMIRFNSKGKFNLPVGNVDFNKNVYNALCVYEKYQLNRNLNLSNLDFEHFLKIIDFEKNSFVYCDPPYLISMSEYNKFWNSDQEERLYRVLDELNMRGVKFGITNLLHHKGKTNQIFDNWSKKYIIKEISSNYISFNDNSIKRASIELYVHNYGK